MLNKSDWATHMAAATMTGGTTSLATASSIPTASSPGWLHDNGSGVRVWSIPSASDVGADASGTAASAVSTHAALQTGVHGISVTAGKTFTCSNSLTLAGTDGSTLNVGAGGTLGAAAFTGSSLTIGSTSVSLGGTAATIAGLTLTTAAVNGTVGATTPSTGAFTTLNASGTTTLGVTTNCGTAAGGTTFTLRGNSGQTATMTFLGPSGNNRWAIFKENTAEGGSDAGSNLRIAAFTDAGAQIDLPLTIARVSAGAIVLGGSTNRPVNFTGNVGFNSTAAIAKPTVSGSRGGNAALASLLTAFASYGLITDSTTV